MTEVDVTQADDVGEFKRAEEGGDCWTAELGAGAVVAASA